MRSIKLIGLGALVVLASGCASIMNDSHQPIKVEALGADGQVSSAGDCTLTNEATALTVRSGQTAQVRRSSKDLDVVCKQAGLPDAQGRAISRVNGGMAGNILFGGGVGAIIDHSRGTAYTYPSWLRLQPGQTLVFDRSLEQEGAPMTGAAPAKLSAANATQ